MKNVKGRCCFVFFSDFDMRQFIPYFMVEKVHKECKMIPFKKDECGLLWEAT